MDNSRIIRVIARVMFWTVLFVAELAARDALAQAAPLPLRAPINGRVTNSIDASASDHMPAELLPWIDWITGKHPEWDCSNSGSTYQCVWPGVLNYELSPTQGSFDLKVELQSRGAVPLPSAPGLFPRAISIAMENGRLVNAALRLEENRLLAELPAGSYVITGKFIWDSLPVEIPVPTEVGIVTAKSAEGDLTAQIQRGDTAATVRQAAAPESRDSLTVTVLRRVIDGSPLQIESNLILMVSGKARSLSFGRVLPSATIPVAVQCALPHQLTADGSLTVQLAPGEHRISMLSVMPQPVIEIGSPLSTLEAWPREETWSWVADPLLRSVEVQGARAAHSELTQLPDAWREGVAYLVDAGSTVKLIEQRRGEQSKAPNAITLRRELWIDFDGGAYTAVDRFQGTLNQNFRLNASAETEVGRAVVDGKPHLITKDPTNGRWGLELRSQALSAEAVSRIDRDKMLPAVGWQTVVDSLGVVLHLPPSWKLLHVSNAGRVPSSWVDSWSLLDIFLCILLVIGARYALNWKIAAVLGLALFLNHGEFLEPRMLVVHLLILVAWSRMLRERESIWQTLCRSLLLVTFCAWTFQVLAFSKLQFTEFLFPQLQSGTRYRTVLQELSMALELSLVSWPFLLAALALIIVGTRSALRAATIWGKIFRAIGYGIVGLLLLVVAGPFMWGLISYTQWLPSPAAQMPAAASIATQQYDSSKKFFSHDDYRQSSAAPAERAELDKADTMLAEVEEPASKALLAGPAIPTWRWRTHGFTVPGPVTAESAVRLYLLPPWLNRPLSLLRSLLMPGLLLMVMVALGYGRFLRAQRDRGAAAALALALPLLFMPRNEAFAEVPPAEILQEMEARIVAQRCQSAPCAVIANLQIEISGDRFRMRAEIYSDGLSSIPFPGPLLTLQPRSVRIDGRETTALRRSESGFLELRTLDGRSIAEAEGPLPRRDAFSLEFAQQPLTVDVSAADWFVEGIQPGGAVANTLQFTKRSTKDTNIAVLRQKSRLSSWVIARREIFLGEQSSVHTRLTRLGDQSEQFRVKVPLLDGEQVTTGSVAAEDRTVTATFPPGGAEISYRSVLPAREKITLTAVPADSLSEEWRVRCGQALACTVDGLKPTRSVTDGIQAWQWHPFPQEQVSVTALQLSGISGTGITIESASHDLRWGTQLREGSLALQAHVTQQTKLQIAAPEGSALKNVTVDGVAGGSVDVGVATSLLLNPGQHQVAVTYASPWQPSYLETVPAVNLNTPAHNVTVRVLPSPDRWILWTGGVSWGPCVVFWSKLLFVIVLCIALAHFGLLPLGRGGAAILAIGLATEPMIIIWLPLLWLAMLHLLGRYEQVALRFAPLVRNIAVLALTALALAILYDIVRTGLVLQPPMLIVGNSSNAQQLRWIVDHAGTTLPQPWVFSVPLWWWRVFALLWSTWLVIAIVSWLRLTADALRKRA